MKKPVFVFFLALTLASGQKPITHIPKQISVDGKEATDITKEIEKMHLTTEIIGKTDVEIKKRQKNLQKEGETIVTPLFTDLENKVITAVDRILKAIKPFWRGSISSGNYIVKIMRDACSNHENNDKYATALESVLNSIACFQNIISNPIRKNIKEKLPEVGDLGRQINGFCEKLSASLYCAKIEVAEVRPCLVQTDVVLIFDNITWMKPYVDSLCKKLGYNQFLHLYELKPVLKNSPIGRTQIIRTIFTDLIQSFFNSMNFQEAIELDKCTINQVKDCEDNDFNKTKKTMFEAISLIMPEPKFFEENFNLIFNKSCYELESNEYYKLISELQNLNRCVKRYIDYILLINEIQQSENFDEFLNILCIICYSFPKIQRCLNDFISKNIHCFGELLMIIKDMHFKNTGIVSYSECKETLYYLVSFVCKAGLECLLRYGEAIVNICSKSWDSNKDLTIGTGGIPTEKICVIINETTSCIVGQLKYVCKEKETSLLAKKLSEFILNRVSCENFIKDQRKALLEVNLASKKSITLSFLSPTFAVIILKLL